MMIKSFLIFTLLTVSGMVQSCITTDSSSVGGMKGEVIERSREKAPSWAGLRPFLMHDQNLNFGYIYLESQQADLPLGIKTAQQNALSRGRDAFKESLTASVQSAAVVANVDFGRLGSAFFTQINSACDHGWAPNAKVADIFFEKFRPTLPTPNGLSEYYNIYVMVELPKSAMSDSLRGVAKQLKSSANPDFRKIGLALENRVALAP